MRRPDLEITSPANSRVKDLVALRRRRVRDAERVVLVEGLEEAALAVEAGAAVRSVFHCPELFLPQSTTTATALIDRLRDSGVETVRLSRQAFEKAAYRQGPDGILLLADTPEWTLEELAERMGEAPLILVSQGVEKPGNLGAMLRTADAVGAAAVIAADPVTDWSNPNVVRASKGAVFALPVASVATEELFDWLQDNGIRAVATTPDTEVLHTDGDLTGGVAILVGTEKHGLTEEALARAQARVRIPMHGLVTSLNVATAAAVVLYEAVRQRGHHLPAAGP